MNWDSFKWRNYQPDIGRFFNVDPLAEKYVHNSTYAFAENKVITFRELEGLEGVHYMEGNDHVVEKNVVVLLQEQKAIPKDADAKTVKKLTRQNERIGRDNAARVAGVVTDLNDHYNGAKNSAGDNVKYKFNVTGMADFDKTGMTRKEIDAQYKSISMSNGLAGTKTAFGKTMDMTAPAAVITNEGSGGDQGSTKGNIVRMNYGAPAGGMAHEVLHGLGLDDNGYTSGGLLNSPPGSIISSEVDLTLKNSYEKKKD